MSRSSDAASVRVDVWTWAVRLYPSRSAAAAACRAGHVKVNGTSVKPAHPIRPGDLVRARRSRDERIVVVTGLIERRVGAALAADAAVYLRDSITQRLWPPATVARYP